jgi:hypothetical protein
MNPVRAVRDLKDLINEVTSHVDTAGGSGVMITVEIDADSGRFDDRTRRTVRENATRPGFNADEFEGWRGASNRATCAKLSCARRGTSWTFHSPGGKALGDAQEISFATETPYREYPVDSVPPLPFKAHRGRSGASRHIPRDPVSPGS